VKLSRQNLIVGGVAAAIYVAVLVIAIAAGRPGRPNVPFALLLLLGIAAHIGWSAWRFFTGRVPRDAPLLAGRVSLELVGASSIVVALTMRDETTPWSLAAAFGWVLAFLAMLAAGAWALWAQWRKRR
jgi:hypothetical protein